MGIQKYISDLLYRYDCVIVPNFGGFVTNKIGAQINTETQTFSPPTKQLSFNVHLKNNDGLLANHIAEVMHVPYDAAINYITSQVKEWHAILDKDILEFDGIGSFSKNLDNNLLFEPATHTNYLTSSFGLSNFHSPEVQRVVYKEQVEKLSKVIPIIPSEKNTDRKKAPLFLKYAAAIAILATLGSYGWKAYQQNKNLNVLASTEKQQVALNTKIQKATFQIPESLPAISLYVTKEAKNYHIIAGAFREPENASKKVKQLKAKGFNAKIIGVNKWNLTEVTYDSFASKIAALKNLRRIKRTVSSDAWLLVKKL